MWIYSDRLSILIIGGLRPIAPCPLPLLGRRAVTAILRYGLRGRDSRNFRFSNAHALTIGSIPEMLVGCSGG